MRVLLLCSGVPASARIGPALETVVWDLRVHALRQQAEVAIPDGFETVGNHWFYGTAVRAVVVPASVVAIGTEAFCCCARLERLEFRANLQRDVSAVA